MTEIFFAIAFFLILLSTGGFIVYFIKQDEKTFRLSFLTVCAAFVFHTVFLALRYYELDVPPVVSLKSTFSFFAWCIVVVYIAFHLRFRVMILGSFLMPMAAAFICLSAFTPGVETTINPILRSMWFLIHVMTIFIGDGIFAIAFVSALMYLIQERRIKRKHFGAVYRRLPSLETLDSLNHHSIIYGFPFLTVGMIAGAMYAQNALGSYWRWDPKEVWTLITWLAYAILLHERLAVGWRGRRAAWMSIFCFLILIFTFLGGGLWLSGYHSFRNFGAGQGL
jgi:cytochrome c-type biogenesis protein CcsB